MTDVSGVTLENGSKLTADVVVAADGVNLKSRAGIDGNRDAPISSGFITYSISFPVAPALEKSHRAGVHGTSGLRVHVHRPQGAYAHQQKRRRHLLASDLQAILPTLL